MLKKSVISRVRSTSEIADIKYVWYIPKKVFFFFIFPVKGKSLTFSSSHFSLILLSSARLVRVIFGVNIDFT